jgi:glycosyltransferase involved in cell wall biosynthesis
VRHLAVVVPARDEAQLLPAALRALAAAAAHPRVRDVRVLTVVVADSCRDGTGAIAERAGAVVVRGRFRNPGRARAAGARHALALLAGAEHETWLASTDADSTVPPQWLAQHAEAAADGWDALVGTVAVPGGSPLELRHQALYDAGRPGDGTAWHHRHVHGANLGVAAPAYRAVGGFPPLATGEDHALVAALERAGHRVLRTAAAPVTTSARLRGRAVGGFADHLAGLAARAPAP